MKKHSELTELELFEIYWNNLPVKPDDKALEQSHCDFMQTKYCNCGYNLYDANLLTFGIENVPCFAVWMQTTDSNCASSYLGRPIANEDDYLFHVKQILEERETEQPVEVSKKVGRPALPFEIKQQRQQEANERSKTWQAYIQACQDRKARIAAIRQEIKDVSDNRDIMIMQIKETADKQLAELKSDLANLLAVTIRPGDV